MSNNILDGAFEFVGELFGGHGHESNKPESGLPEHKPETIIVASQRDRLLKTGTFSILNALQWAQAAEYEASYGLKNPESGVRNIQLDGNRAADSAYAEKAPATRTAAASYATNQAMNQAHQKNNYMAEDQARQAVADSHKSILTDDAEVPIVPPELDTYEKSLTYMSRDPQAIAELNQREYANNVLVADGMEQETNVQNIIMAPETPEVSEALAKIAAIHDESKRE